MLWTNSGIYVNPANTTKLVGTEFQSVLTKHCSPTLEENDADLCMQIDRV